MGKDFLILSNNSNENVILYYLFYVVLCILLETFSIPAACSLGCEIENHKSVLYEAI